MMEDITKSQDYIINQWLKKINIISEIAEIENIHTDEVSENVRNLALQRSGFVNLPLKYITDKGWFRQYQYVLLLKSESEIDEQKLLSYQWLDELTDILSVKNNNKDYPELGDNKVIKNISCENAMKFEENEDGSISVYYLQLYFDIRKED